MLKLLLSLTFLVSSAHSHCWHPGSNPFTGPPKANRLDGESVRLDWGNVFLSGAGGCPDVDFLIKSHPRFQPSAYKLSDYTLKGQRSAVLQIDGNTDYVFQVIAREDRGSEGIEYKYSPMVTSYATDLKQQKRKPSTTTTTMKPRTYRPPPVRSMNTIYDDYHKTTSRPVTRPRSSSKLDQCIPMLRKQGGFGPGTNMRQDRILINFVRYLNQRPSEILPRFLETKRSCKEEHKKGYLTQCSSAQACCPNPWSQCAECNTDFRTCDGRCIPSSYVNDGWPDCLDGSDESDPELPLVLQCVECSGVVLAAVELCQLSGLGVTEECVHDIMGQGDCNVCVKEFMI